MNKKIEGYWYSKYHKQYPMPIPNQLTDKEASAICMLIKMKEKEAKVRIYKGWSNSRITGEKLGCREFETEHWIWPSDFTEHYVHKHKVKPTDAFLKYIGYNDIKIKGN